MLLCASVFIVSCGGGGGDATATATASTPASAGALAALPPAAATTSPDGAAAVPPPLRGKLLSANWSTYPRLIRLAHQADSAKDGLIVASISERGASGWRPGLFLSGDEGLSFSPLAAIADSDFATGVCCGSLFELPQAVGHLPRGTLLYSTSVGYDLAGSQVQNRIYTSFDAGRSWARLQGADCGASAVPRQPGSPGSGVWEPEFLLAGDGSLACVYSDETEPGRSQVLKLTRTTDGSHWSVPRVIVAGADANDRPGMAGIRRLADGSFLMAFEVCSLSRLDCSVRLKTSADGLAWGAPSDLGIRPQTADGSTLRGTPTLTWVPVAGQAAGELILSGQMLFGPDGAVDTVRTGRVLMINRSASPVAGWQTVASPIGLVSSPPATSNWCQNYSSPLLAVSGDSRLLMLQTDRSADDGCQTRFGIGILP